MCDSLNKADWQRHSLLGYFLVSAGCFGHLNFGPHFLGLVGFVWDEIRPLICFIRAQDENGHQLGVVLAQIGWCRLCSSVSPRLW